MILHDHIRRWYEVRFYYFCLDIYHIRKNMLDVMGIIEAIAQIGNFNVRIIKQLAGRMISDPYYLPTQDELIILCAITGVPQKDIADYLGKSQPTISKIINTRRDTYSPYPRLDIDEDSELGRFMDLVDLFKKAGI